MAPNAGEDQIDVLLHGLQSLAMLLPNPAFSDFKTVFSQQAVDGLSRREIRAVTEFYRAGQHCMGTLRGATINLLNKHMAPKFRARESTVTLPVTMSSNEDDGEARTCVYEMFSKFDIDGDGHLSRDEFMTAFGSMTDGQFDSVEIEKMLNMADVNNDGVVDIHEFTVWLYSAGQNLEETPSKEDSSKEDSSKGTSEGLRAVEALKERVEALEVELKVKQAALDSSDNEKRQALDALEEKHEQEMDATNDFWKEVAKTATATINQKVDIENSEWLGNGKFGFVLKAERHSDEREVVVKMMGIRWAHMAVKEWSHGSLVGKHPSIVDYEEVMLHADNDKSLRRLIEAGFEEGVLKSKKKRLAFPDRYICLTVELMNRGTVQDWMDDRLLELGGMFVVMQKVAEALAYMHHRKLTHNDIKPENVMVHQDTHDSEPIVKLGDLGLCTASLERDNDFWQYGMTVFCMATGEKFGARKYRPQDAEGFVEECASVCRSVPANRRGRSTLDEISKIMSSVFANSVSMEQVRDWEALRGWSFFEDAQSEEAVAAKRNARRQSTAQGIKLQENIRRRYTMAVKTSDE